MVPGVRGCVENKRIQKLVKLEYSTKKGKKVLGQEEEKKCGGSGVQVCCLHSSMDLDLMCPIGFEIEWDTNKKWGNDVFVFRVVCFVKAP